jgi:hypothetical protein
MKTRRLRLPPTPSPAVEKLRDYLRAIYAAPMPWHSEQEADTECQRSREFEIPNLKSATSVVRGLAGGIRAKCRHN